MQVHNSLLNKLNLAWLKPSKIPGLFFSWNQISFFADTIIFRCCKEQLLLQFRLEFLNNTTARNMLQYFFWNIFSRIRRFYPYTAKYGSDKTHVLEYFTQWSVHVSKHGRVLNGSIKEFEALNRIQNWHVF